MEARDHDQTLLIKKLLETVTASSGELQSSVPENIAQFLTTALSQVIQTTQDDETAATASDDIQRQYLTPADNVESIVEVAGYSIDQRPIGVKFPAEVRKKIVSMRKEGLKCRDIAKELGASVSGVQKVWERFLATGTIRDRKPSTYAGRPRKYSAPDEDGLTVTAPLCISEGTYIETVSPKAVLIDTREPMEVPGATVEVIASTTTTDHSKGDMESYLVKKKSKHPYRQDLLLRLVDDCPLGRMRKDIAMATSPHLLNLSESVKRPLYMEYVLGHPFGKAPSPKPFDANLEESRVILTDPVNPLGKEVIAALGYSTKVYFNACCEPSALFDKERIVGVPYSIGPAHIGQTMREVLQLLVDLCVDPGHALSLVQKGPGPVLQAQSSTGDVMVTTFAPPTKLSEYWSQLYSYAKIFQCCENFLSATPPSCPCLICHPFESFASSLEITEVTPPTTPIAPPTEISTIQLLQTRPHLDTPTHDDIISQVTSNEEVCTTEETTPIHDTDGIQYVAYSLPSDERGVAKRSARKRQHPRCIKQGKHNN